MAIDNQTYPTGYKQRYQSWKKGTTNKGVQNPRNEQVDVNTTWEAQFLKEFNVKFQNQFTGVSGNPGTIKVNSIPKNSPHIAQVTETNSVTG